MNLEKILTILKIRARLMVSAFFIVLLMILSLGLLTPRIYESTTSIFIQRKIPTSDMTEKDTNNLFGDSDIVDHVKILKSNAVLTYVAQKLKNKYKHHPVLSRQKIAKRTQVISAKNTKVVELHFQDNDRHYASDLLKFTLEGYEITLKDIARSSRLKAIQFLRDRLAETQKERNHVETELAKLQSESGTTDIDSKNNKLLDINNTYTQSLSELDARIVAAESDVEHLQEMIGLSAEDIQAFSRIKSDSQIQAWQETLGEEQAKLSDLQAVYTDKYSEVSEKKRSIQHLEKLIEQRIKGFYSGPTKVTHVTFSQLDQALGQQLLEQQVSLISLLGQKAHYQKLLSTLSPEFSVLATQKQKITDLQFRLDNLKQEETSLTSKLNNGALEEEIMSSLGNFTVITPPTLPKAKDYVFPMKAKDTVVGGIFSSLLLALFVVALAEYFDPRLISIEAFPVLAEIKKLTRDPENSELKNAFHSLALLVNKFDYQTITFCHLLDEQALGHSNLHLFGDNDRHYETPSKAVSGYSPSDFGYGMAQMFAKRVIKTILVDCTQDGSNAQSDVDAGLEPMLKILDYTLYKNTQNPYLHVLRPNSKESTPYFDPYILKLLPKEENYQLTLVNSSVGEHDSTTTSLMCECSDATVLGVSQTKTPSVLLRGLQHLVQTEKIKLVGSFIFP